MNNTKTKLFAALLLSSSTLYSCEGNSQAKSTNVAANTEQQAETTKAVVQNIGQEEFQKIPAEENTVVMDVRTPDEVAEGYIQGATLFADINGASFDAEIAKLDKSKSYLVYCRSGGRSGRAAQMMIDAGFSKVYNLNGGISGWSGAVAK